MQFNERKAIEAAYEVVKISGGKTTIMRLVKLLYLIDRYALENWERTVTTDNHVSMPHGTVTSKIYNIHKNNKISNLWQKYLNSTSRIVSIKEELPIAKLSRREIDAIHKIVANYSDLATNQLRAITHKLPEYTETNSSIPISIDEILTALNINQKNINRIKADISREEAIIDALGG